VQECGVHQVVGRAGGAGAPSTGLHQQALLSQPLVSKYSSSSSSSSFSCGALGSVLLHQMVQQLQQELGQVAGNNNRVCTC
jgi:hypothetical protein